MFYTTFSLILMIISIQIYTEWRVDKHITVESYTSFDTLWGYEGEDYSLPYKFPVKENESLKLTNKLPEMSTQEEFLCFRTTHQEVRVFINDQLIYECVQPNNQGERKSIRDKRHFISLSGTTAGDKIALEFTSPYKKYTGHINSIWYGNINVILLDLFKRIIINLLLGFLAVLLGILILVAKIIGTNNLDNSLIYLGLFFIVFGVWSWVDAKVILIPESASIGYEHLKIFMLMLIPIILLLYIREKYSLKKSIALNVQIVVYSLNFIICNILQLLNIADFVELTPITVNLIIISTGYILFIIFLRKRNLRCSNFLQYAGFLILVCCSVLEIILYINNEFYSTGMYIKIGWIFFLILQLTIFIMEASVKLKNQRKIKIQLEKSKIKLMIHQMEPHFFSNALVAIQDLCYTNPQKAADTISLFYLYLRKNIDFLEQQDLVNFEYEKEYINTYMKIQKVCFGEDIEYMEDIKINDFNIPPLTIQPFIENAVRHGIRKRSGLGIIRLSTSYSKAGILILIEDNGVGFDTNKIHNYESGFSSTENVIYRLEKLCSAKVLVESVLGTGTTIKIEIPINSEVK